jgi:hypothetical protein
MESCTTTLKSLEEADFMVFKAKWLAYKIRWEFMKKQKNSVGFFDESFIRWCDEIRNELGVVRRREMYDEEGAGGVRKAIETEDEHNLHERYIFNSKLQQDENIDEYVRKLQKLAKTYVCMAIWKVK